MSRIGKLPIKIEANVKVAVGQRSVSFDGPKGKLTVPIASSDIAVEVKGTEIIVTRGVDTSRTRAMHGLTRALLANAAHGVGKGWELGLAIRGVGYRAEVKGKQVHFALGYSHPVVYSLPEGVTAEVGKTQRTEEQLPTLDLTLRSADRHMLGQTAVQIRALRPPEPYKGKGIKLSTERVRRKEGKTGAA